MGASGKEKEAEKEKDSKVDEAAVKVAKEIAQATEKVNSKQGKEAGKDVVPEDAKPIVVDGKTLMYISKEGRALGSSGEDAKEVKVAEKTKEKEGEKAKEKDAEKTKEKEAEKAKEKDMKLPEKGKDGKGKVDEEEEDVAQVLAGVFARMAAKEGDPEKLEVDVELNKDGKAKAKDEKKDFAKEKD